MMSILKSRIMAAVIFFASLWHSASAADFFTMARDEGVSLPADQFYPKGRRLAYMGYSGISGRDLTNGFTVAGPVYGDQSAFLAECFSNHRPVVAQIGGPLVPGGFLKGAAGAKYAPDEVKKAVASLVETWASHPEIIWWAVTPEELRPWQKDEMEYLSLVADTIRASDPMKRPVFLYNPNHRDAKTLEPIARVVDILGKGAYVNSSGKKNERGWVRWGMEQELAAAEAGGRNAMCLLMPELCKDPDPSERGMIRTWVRHDIYLGLASGAKGVLLWSLFPRKEVRETWQVWYDAYAECGRELSGALNLGTVFLFGEKKNDLKVEPETVLQTRNGKLGGDAEANTTSDAEREVKTIEFEPMTVFERAFGPKRYLFVVNSTPEAAVFRVSGFPASAKAESLFTGGKWTRVNEATIRLELPAWGTGAFVFEKQ